MRFSSPWRRRARRSWHLPVASSARSASTSSTSAAARSTCTTISFPRASTANPRPWSPQVSLDQMDRFGIGVAILSMTQNGELLYNGTEKGRTEIRRGNDYRRRAGAAVPEAVRPDRRRAATRPRRLAQGDRVRLRHAEGGRHRHLQQRQPGALAGRPLLRADVAGAEPPQRHRLHAPAGAARAAAT